jgi:uncharacterized protein
VLEGLIGRELVVRLPRRPGQREERYAHLLGGEAPEDIEAAAAPAPPDDRLDRLDRLEREVADLRAQLQELREAIGA